eukprot:scaffold1772_cov34-Cyclotella_meneghiniana.AAC.2
MLKELECNLDRDYWKMTIGVLPKCYAEVDKGNLDRVAQFTILILIETVLGRRCNFYYEWEWSVSLKTEAEGRLNEQMTLA